MSPEDRAPRSYRGLPADGPALVLRTPGAVALGDGQPSMLQEITRRRMRWPGGEFRYQTRTCGGSLRIRGRPTNCRVGCKKDRNEYCQLPMCFYRCLLVGFVMTACSRRAPTERAPLVAPPSPQPIAPSTPTPPLALTKAPPAPDVSVAARDASPPSPGACVFVGGNARCTRCIVRSCRAALAACCASDRCRAGLPGLGACLTNNPGNESALTGCWDMFNAEGGTAAEPTLRECMEQGPCGLCEVPR